MNTVALLQHGDTLAGLFEARVAATPDAPAYIEYSRSLGRWFERSWRSVSDEAGQTQAFLRQLGFEAGDRIGIMARGSVYWVCLDVAAAGLGIVTVPLYYRDRGGNVAQVIKQCGLKALFIGGPTEWERLAESLEFLDAAPPIWSATEVPGSRVRAFFAELAEIEHCAYRVDAIDAQAVATIVFTSGTTGRPRGVQLTHANILSNAVAATEAVPISPSDQLLSFLPLSHMFERTVGYYAPMLHGSVVAFARSVQTLREDILLHPPTILVSVPRVYERIYGKLSTTLPLESSFGRVLLWLVRRLGMSRPFSPWRLLAALPAWLMARRLRKGLGGRLRLAITGGAAMNPKVAHFFAGLGLKVLQGYGLTETSPVISVNREEDVCVETVGPPLSGVETRISEKGELQVRGPGVMRGYLDDAEATAEVIDAEGWFHTGDLACFEDGHIRIIGRAKEILVLSTGEKVPPENLERALMEDPDIRQAWVTGDGQPFLAAVLIMRKPADEEELVQRANRLLAAFPGYARIQRIHVGEEPWSEANGVLTATLKLRRGVLQERYARVLEEFYGE